MSVMARQQINIRADSDLLEAIEEIRRLQSPIPTVTEAVRRAIFAERDRLRRLVARDQARETAGSG